MAPVWMARIPVIFTLSALLGLSINYIGTQAVDFSSMRILCRIDVADLGSTPADLLLQWSVIGGSRKSLNVAVCI